MRPFLGLLLVLVVGCDNCDPLELSDVSCKPSADGSVGFYDPTLRELCNNHIDDNCDGRINEGCACVDGDLQTCGTDVGECESARVVCVEGRWPGCVPPRSPEPESCNGLDDDCDGQVDNIDPLNCWTGPDGGVGKGECKSGQRACSDGGWTACLGQVLPSRELCNLKDDNCDGVVDNDVRGENDFCGPDEYLGVCRAGRQHCVGAEFLCVGATYPSNEACNNVDDDCDGDVDEDLFRLCTTACGNGVETCIAGTWANCTAQAVQPEICDGLDNNCDGTVDEGLDCPCIIGETVLCSDGLSCGVGASVCQPPGIPGPCVFVGTSIEMCDAWDNDCDGVVDHITEACADEFAGVGECVAGQHACEMGQWDACVGAVVPQEEICNSKDDDCDGLVDEDLNPHDKVDMVFIIDISGSMQDYIDALKQAIIQYSGDLANTEHHFGLVVFPGDIAGQSQFPGRVVQDLAPVGVFQATLSNLLANGNATEPSYDVLAQVSCPANPLGLSWRADAYPYVVLIGDEEAQTYTNITENVPAACTTNCQLPGCVAGDKVEIYSIMRLVYAAQYDTIVYQEMDRLLEIWPADEQRYIGLLRQILTDVCF